MAGQNLEVVNDDQTTHNIHPIPKDNREWNKSQPPGAPPIIESFARGEVCIPVKCNVHPWMKSYIAVFKQPYFIVTGPDGSFDLKDLPPGTYTMEAWQEKYGTMDQQVTVGPKESKTVNFDFQGARRLRAISRQFTPVSLGAGRVAGHWGPALPVFCWEAAFHAQPALNLGRITCMNRALNRFATFTAGCTFLLLMAGALVTGNDAADSVPDWPLAYGRVIPPLIGGIRFEFAHRVVAGIVAILTLVLAIWIWRAEKRRAVRRLGWTALALVIAQALLGALRVLEGHPAIVATSHAILAQIFFIAVVSLAVVTGEWWQSPQAELRDSGSPSHGDDCRLDHRDYFCADDSRRGIPSWRLRHCAAFGGRGGGDGRGDFLGRTVRIRFHDVKPLRQPVIFLHAFFGLQILLGGAALWAVQAQQHAAQPLPLLVSITVAHILGGALLLAASVVLTLRCYRLIPGAHSLAQRSRDSGSAI